MMLWSQPLLPFGKGVLAFLFALLLGLAVGGAACTKAQVWEQRTAPTGIAPRDAVAVILGDYSSPKTRTEEDVDGDRSGIEGNAKDEVEEDWLISCIRDAILKVHPTVRIVPSQEFRRAAFGALDVAPKPWGELIKDTQFKERIAPLGLRYLILVSGETGQNLKFSSGSIMPPVLRLVGPKDTSLKASVLDITHGRPAGKLDAFALGRVMILILPLPIPMKLAFTESLACEKLGEAVANFLGDKSP